MPDERPFVNLSADELEAIWRDLLIELDNRRVSSARRLKRAISDTVLIAPDRSTSVYVIELDEAVRGDKGFTEDNPAADPALPCLYVGMTSLSPQERFEQHKAGIKASRYVKKYGIRLRPEFYERLNPMAHAEAEAEEVALAELLRREGYAVRQN